MRRGRHGAVLFGTPAVVLLVALAIPGPAAASDGPSRAADVPIPTARIRTAQTLRSAPPSRRATADATNRVVGGGTGSPVARVPISSPSFTTLDPVTGTLYVSKASRDVDVVDVTGCNAQRLGRCSGAVVGTVPGAGDGALLADRSTRTLYVGSFDAGTVTAVDLATCNARVTSGCGGVHPSIGVGSTLLGLAVDPGTHTLYVGHVDPYVSIVDTATCNARTSSGCTGPAPTITTGQVPAFPTVDPTTATLYVPENGNDADGTGMAVFDVRTCNATTRTGCAPSAEAVVGVGPVAVVVDQSTRTLYVENQTAATVSVLDAGTCNARVTTGCGTPASTAVGPNPGANLTVDPRTRTLYVLNAESDTVSAVDTRHCRTGDTTGCAQRWPTLQTGTGPFWMDGDPSTGSLFVIDGIGNDLVVLDARACSAVRQDGCRHETPSVAVDRLTRAAAVDPAHHTALFATGAGDLALLDTRSCRAGETGDCAGAVQTTPIGALVSGIAVDPGTHSAFVGDLDGNRVLVLDTNTCHAGSTAGCAPVAVVGTGTAGPWVMAVNPRTHTAYGGVPDSLTVAVLGPACTAVTPSRCPATAQLVPMADSVYSLDVDPVSNSVFAGEFTSNQVQLLPGAACDAGTAGCAVIATLPTGSVTGGLAVDPGTRTLYVDNQAFDDAPGTVSVVDLRSCNAARTTGCAGPFPTAPTGRGPFGIAVDPVTHTLFTGDIGNGTVSVINGSRCNGTITSGCSTPPALVPTAPRPTALALDPTTRTVYVVAPFSKLVSVVDARSPCSAPVRCLA